jgi:hypothetical protein
MSKSKQANAKILSWRESPAQYVHDNFAVDPDKWQIEALNSLGGSGYNPQRRLCLKACTGPGKSAVLAWNGWHRLTCFAGRGEHPKGAALSITRENLRDNLWTELAKWQSRSEFLKTCFTWTKERIYSNDHSETWFLSARSFAKDADEDAIGRALSGLHSKFPFILLDEIGDMPIPVIKAAEQIFTGSPIDALILAAGNPTSSDGLLYHLCNKLRHLYHVITITADPEDPNRTARVDIELARQQIKEYGRDNPWVMATILGLFPSVGFRNLLGIEEVEAAMNRKYEPGKFSFAPMIVGVDVAREGDDKTVIFPRQGLSAFPPTALRSAKSHEVGGAVAIREDELKSDATIVDGTGGWGSGVIDWLSQIGRSPMDCQFAGKADDPKYANKRAEIWFKMADWIKKGGSLPRVDALIAELTTPTYTFKGDKFLIEPKEDIKKRLGRSPDYADALAVTFAFEIVKSLRSTSNQSRGGTDYDPLGHL